MDKRLLDLLVCPICKGPLRASGSGATMELICRPDRLAYGRPGWHSGDASEEARVLGLDDPLLSRCNKDHSRVSRRHSRALRSHPSAGKPLLPIASRPLIQWVWESACNSGAASVVVATDDERILQAH